MRKLFHTKIYTAVVLLIIVFVVGVVGYKVVSDYSWIDIIDILGPSDHLLVLKKPFDADEAQQMALAMTRRAAKTQEQIEYIKSLEAELKNCRENIDRLESDLSAKDKG